MLHFKVDSRPQLISGIESAMATPTWRQVRDIANAASVYSSADLYSGSPGWSCCAERVDSRLPPPRRDQHRKRQQVLRVIYRAERRCNVFARHTCPDKLIRHLLDVGANHLSD